MCGEKRFFFFFFFFKSHLTGDSLIAVLWTFDKYKWSHKPSPFDLDRGPVLAQNYHLGLLPIWLPSGKACQKESLCNIVSNYSFKDGYSWDAPIVKFLGRHNV